MNEDQPIPQPDQLAERKISIKEAPREYAIQSVNLTTETGKPFQLEIVSGFMNAVETNRRAWNRAVLVTLPTEVNTSSGSFASKEPVSVLFLHGRRDLHQKHVVLPTGLSSEEVVQAVRQHLQEKGLPPVTVLISCDSALPGGIKTRWDQGPRGREIEVLGFSGAANFATTDFERKSIVINVDDAMGPHPFKPHHPMYDMVFNKFRPTKIVIK